MPHNDVCISVITMKRVKRKRCEWATNDDNSDKDQKSCEPFRLSYVPLHCRSHCPPIVSVQGEAANPGPCEDASEANLTLYFGNVGSMNPVKNRDKIH
eukprot:7206441-Karenia_brevis.AAC.1